MHQGNLYCGDIFKIPEYAGALKKGHAARMWIKVHHWSYRYYMRNGGSAIQSVSETRAVGAALECEAILKNKDSMVATLHSDVFNVWVSKQQRNGEKGRASIAVAEAHRTSLTDPEVWKMIEEAWLVSEPAIKLARVGDSAKPTMGMVLDAWNQAGDRINELPMATTAPNSRIRQIQALYADRRKAALNALHYAAYALEPSFLSKDIFSDESVMEGLNSIIHTMSSAHPLKDEAATRAIREFHIYRAKQGLFARDTVSSMIDKMPSFQWFQQYGASVPHLQWFAVRILAMQSGGAAPERFYSKLGWIKNKRRNRLGHEKTEKLLFVHLNLVLKHKIEKLEFEEATKVHHTLGESHLDDAGIEIEPMVLLQEMDNDFSFWGMNDAQSQANSSQ